MTAGHFFNDGKDAEVPADPDEVWAAIATGPGIDSWFMGRNDVQPGAGGVVRTEFGAYTPELEITAWDPSRRFAYGSGEEPDGRFIAYEFIIEARGDSSTVLRVVTSGFIPGDDWADEYEAMTLGGELFFRTLLAYLGHFTGRFAEPVTAFGPPGTDWERDRELLCRALGLTGNPAEGDKARFIAPGSGPVEGVVYFANVATIGIRTSDAFYRFLQGFGKPVVMSHQMFGNAAIPGNSAAQAWESWLAQVLTNAERRNQP